MADHPTVSLHLKYVAVDRLMVPVVAWLNHFPGVFTRWCCQGDDEQHPYVIFHCDHPATLARILAELYGSATVEVEWYADAAGVRYCARFCSHRQFLDFTAHLMTGRVGGFGYWRHTDRGDTRTIHPTSGTPPARTLGGTPDNAKESNVATKMAKGKAGTKKPATKKRTPKPRAKKAGSTNGTA